MLWNWRGPIVVLILVAGYFGYRYYSQTANMCGRDETRSVLKTILHDNNVGDLDEVTHISTLRSAGNQTFCGATFTLKQNGSGYVVSKDGVEYVVNISDDRNSLYVSVPGTSLMLLRQ